MKNDTLIPKKKGFGKWEYPRRTKKVWGGRVPEGTVVGPGKLRWSHKRNRL